MSKLTIETPPAVPDDTSAPASDFAAEHAARVSAEATVFMRDRVLSIVSHDLRGPLNAIHSWAHVLERKLASEDPGIARAITGIRTGVEQQVKLIEEVIDRTRAATRHLALQRTVVPVAPLLAAELANIRATLAVLHGITVDAHLDIDDAQASLDEQRFAQAVWTMLAYAVESDRAGAGGLPVELRAHRQGRKMEVAVVFTPAGSDADATALPSPGIFTSVPATLDHGKLPLTLPTRIAEAHDGELSDEELVDGRRRIALHCALAA